MKTSRGTFLPALGTALLAWMLASCVMGGGSDQPNKLAGSLREADGGPAAGALVRLYKGDYQPGYDRGLETSDAVLISETRADASGAYAFPDPGAGNHYVEVLSADSSAVVIRDSLGRGGRGLDAGTLDLRSASGLAGLITGNPTVLSLHLAGTHHKVRTDAAGAFRFPPLPAGPALLVAAVGGESSERLVLVRAVLLEEGKQLVLESIRLGRDSLPPGPDTSSRILLYDFESDSRRNLLERILFPASLPSGDMTGSWYPAAWVLDTAGAYRGRSLRGVKGEQGFFLGKGYYDLTRMQDFAFQAKGTGTLIVRFRSALAKTGMGTFQARVQLTPEWRRHVIKPSDIAAPAGSELEKQGLTFDKAKDQVVGVLFTSGSTAPDFQLDDIELVGVNPSDL